MRIWLKKLIYRLRGYPGMEFRDTCPKCGSAIHVGLRFRKCYFCQYEDEYR